MDTQTEYDSINEFAVVGAFGFQRVPGPFDVIQDGTVWEIAVPVDAHPTVTTLPNQEGEAAVLVADARIIGGGILTDVIDEPEDKMLHLLVDQYARGSK